ncbi:hypothetical protein [Burkholderia pseudomultivorans]|uniref:hypothetical protein n=1 Tax=Burkholderia pseudomultivorans TaxID=1207504 RepID=UPI001E4D3268|nr:hypothetical protein [Burkholderia pseudomultivorans]
MKTSEIINDVANEIEKILREYDTARPNPIAIEKLELQYNRMRLHCGYCAEKIRNIVVLANDFYSTRRHQFHPGGADGIFRDICELLDAIRSWSNVWKQHNK